MVTSSASSTPVQSMEIFLPSRSSSSTHPVSMLKWQALASYFIIASSKSCYWLTVYDKVSEFYAVHGSLHSQTRRKRKIRTLLQSETGSDFSCLVGAGGFEPPKLKAADLQSVPIGHSGTRPYSLFVSVRRTTCLFYHSFPVLSTAILTFPKKKTRSPTLPFPAPRPSAAQVHGRHDGYFHLRSPE